MKHPSHWNRKDLEEHLQHALDLELWTIPLYLTSLYSIKGIDDMDHADFPPAAKLVYSVVVQEMLHAELVANLCLAMGFKPRFDFPEYDSSKGIPFIHPPASAIPKELAGYEVKPQALNEQALKLFCAIELPRPKREIDWNEESEYDSIAELYEAIRIGVEHHWDSCFVGAHVAETQKETFNEYCNTDEKQHGFSVVIQTLDDALNAIEAIVEQGEGADAKHVPSEFQPPSYHHSDNSDIAWYKGDLSHYQKFKILLHSSDKLPEVYSDSMSDEAMALNREMMLKYHSFWKTLQNSFHRGDDEMDPAFWTEMFELADSIVAVWKAGMCPRF